MSNQPPELPEQGEAKEGSGRSPGDPPRSSHEPATRGAIDPRESRQDNVPWIPTLIWSGAVLALYPLLRPHDVGGILTSIGQRAADALTPLALLLAHCGTARRCRQLLLGTERSVIGDVTRSVQTTLICIVFVVCLHTMLLWIGAFTVPAVLALATGSALASWRQWPQVGAEFGGALRSLRIALRSGTGMAAVVVAAMSLLLTLTPAISQDALHYHLEVPQQWISSGGLTETTGNVYARFPMNTEVLFATALALRGEISAKCVHWLFAMLAALSVGLLARSFGSRRTAYWSVLIFLSVPTVFRVASWAYVDVVALPFLLAAWNALRARGALSPRGCLWVALLCGFACGVKYTFVVSAIPLVLLACARVPRQVRLQSAISALLFGTVAGGFWYVRNWIELGNPVFPFLYSWFGGEGWDAERSQIFMDSLRDWGSSGWDLPFQLTFDATFSSVRGFDGMIGPIFLAGVPFLWQAARARPDTRATLLCAGLLFLAWLPATRQVRFLLPTLALLAALIPVGWELLPKPGQRFAARCLAVIAIVLTFPAHWLLVAHERPAAFALGLENEHQWRRRNLPGGDYELFRHLPRWVKSDERLLIAACGNPRYLCRVPYHADSVVENHTLREFLRRGPDDAAGLQAAGFSHLLFRTELVFGAISDLTTQEKATLQRVLNRDAKLVVRQGDTVLYRLGTVVPPVRGT